MNNFKKLIVWQKAREFVKEVYILTKKFPREEQFGLTSQIRRAVISIVSNIAEGSGRGSDNEFAHFLDIAQGSAYEVETQIILSFDLEYITLEEFTSSSDKILEIQKMINKLAETKRRKTEDARQKMQDTRQKTQDTSLKSEDTSLNTNSLNTNSLFLKNEI